MYSYTYHKYALQTHENIYEPAAI